VKWPCTFGALAALCLSNSICAQEPDSGPEPAWYVRAIQERFSASRQYSFDAVVELARKDGEGPRELLARFRIKAAVAPGNRYLLWVGDKSNLQYVVVADGQRVWAFAPEANQYAEIEALPPTTPIDPAKLFSGGVTDRDRDPVLCAQLIVPILAHLSREAAFVEMKRADVSGENEDDPERVLTVLSDQSGGTQNITEVVINSRTLVVQKVDWTHSAGAGDEPHFAMLTATFENFRVDEPLSPSNFVFNPGDAQRVEELPLRGFNGSALIAKAAPDFELPASDRTKARLSELRGQPVVLVFTTPDCQPCARQTAAIATLERQYKGLTVLQIGTGQPGIHRLYGVEFLPTTVVVDARGNVSRFLPGVREAHAIDAVLKTAGP
jgi:outer membrane lipoprotein-sorting protein